MEVTVSHNPKVAGSNPARATMHDEGLADAAAANLFVYPGITQELKTAQVSAFISACPFSSQCLIPISRYVVVAVVR
jgi:hypothetical protein